MGQPEAQTNQDSMRLRDAFKIWAICLGVFIFVLVLAVKLESSFFGNLAFLGYFAIGAYLSRTVLRRIVEWHPMYNTLENVSSEKLWMFMFWPIQYFSLFIRLGINKAL